MNRRRWRTAAVGLLLLVWVGWVAWLLLVPPVVSPAGVPERYHLSCQPLGRDISDVSMLGAMSDEEEGFVDWYAQNRMTGTGDMDRTKSRLASRVTWACSEARTNRLASLVLVVAGALALTAVGTVIVVGRRLNDRDRSA